MYYQHRGLFYKKRILDSDDQTSVGATVLGPRFPSHAAGGGYHPHTMHVTDVTTPSPLSCALAESVETRAMPPPVYPPRYGMGSGWRTSERDAVIAVQGTPKLRQPRVDWKPCPMSHRFCALTQRCEHEDVISCTRDPNEPRGFATHYVFDQNIAPLLGAKQQPYMENTSWHR